MAWVLELEDGDVLEQHPPRPFEDFEDFARGDMLGLQGKGSQLTNCAEDGAFGAAAMHCSLVRTCTEVCT